MAVLKVNNIFSAYEYLLGTLTLNTYLDLVNVMRPVLVCYTPTYLECIHVLTEMHRYRRIVNVGTIFEDPIAVKEQTIRGYLSQKKQVDANKVASLLYSNYINRPDNDYALVGNRKSILLYICSMLKRADTKYVCKQKSLDMFQISGKPKMVSEIDILVSIKARSL